MRKAEEEAENEFFQTTRGGKIRIDTAAKGQFRVAVESGPSQLAIALAIETPMGEPLKLPFASGQEYEVVLRDSEGRVVWKWSADQIFTMALHERTVSGGWSATVIAPRPVVGDYTVHAWLTTMGDAPLFAAAAPVIVR